MMSEFYNVRLAWERETKDYDYKTYNRKHTVFFYGGPKLEVSSSPDFLRNPQYQSPEELLIAAVSSCYLLTFLSITASKGIIIDSYQDNSTCVLGKVKEGKQGITQVILRPVIVFKEGNKPDKEDIKKLFQMAHDHCFIANSLTVKITVTPQCRDAQSTN